MRKRKLLVILGAGSSISCGMPSVKKIDDLMKGWSKEWENLPMHPKGSLGEGVFNELWAVIEDYYRENPRPHLNILSNFEKVLGEMIALASWATPSPFGNALIKAIENGKILSRFAWRDDSTEPFFARQLILEQLGFLLEKLAIHMRSSSNALDKDSKEFLDYKKIISQLRDDYEVGIYNLNYDTVAVNAWPEAFTGFQNGSFEPSAVLQRQEWDFIYHLHGSVHHSLEGPFKKTIVWKDDLKSEFIDSGITLPNTASDFKPIPSTTLIAGGFKLDQLLVDPFQSFYASLIRHVHEADTILIAGYGFSDVHVNRALQNRCDRFPATPDRRPPVVVITKDQKLGSTGLRHDLWAYELTHSLNTRFQNDNMALDASVIENLVRLKRLEKDVIGRVAIWHGGFTESTACIDIITEQLNRWY